MNDIKLSGITIFLLFFGVTSRETVQTRNWRKAVLWAIGVVFLLADDVKGLGARRFENHQLRGTKG